ncbi:MAG: VWA domain-containing protein [Verrucomicrobia bacterium]|nr:VWA domain-containing protein [Verrucomicrobiota bacterium]
MPYTAQISRDNPTCFLFLLDQSGSMADALAGEAGKRKADKVADVVNKFLQNLVIKCGRPEGIRNYFHVGVLGYGASVGPAFGGTIGGRELVPISEVGENPARIEERSKKSDDGAGGLVEQKIKFPIWFDPVANGGTPMCQVLSQAQKLISDWTAKNPMCFPPIVINVTDGESTDGDPTSAADAIKTLSTADGNVLLFNAHISSNINASSILFADSEASLPDDFARLLFRMSSNLTDAMIAGARQEGIAVSSASQGFVFNANLEALINFIDIGTRPGNLR